MHNDGVSLAFLCVQVDFAEDRIGVVGSTRAEHGVTAPAAEDTEGLGFAGGDAPLAVLVLGAIGLLGQPALLAILQGLLRAFGVLPAEATLTVNPRGLSLHAGIAAARGAGAVLRSRVVGETVESGSTGQTPVCPAFALRSAASLAGLGHALRGRGFGRIGLGTFAYAEHLAREPGLALQDPGRVTGRVHSHGQRLSLGQVQGPRHFHCSIVAGTSVARDGV